MSTKNSFPMSYLLDESFHKIYDHIEQLSLMAEKQKDITYATYTKYQTIRKDLMEELKALEFLYKGSVR